MTLNFQLTIHSFKRVMGAKYINVRIFMTFQKYFKVELTFCVRISVGVFDKKTSTVTGKKSKTGSEVTRSLKNISMA